MALIPSDSFMAGAPPYMCVCGCFLPMKGGQITYTQREILYVVATQVSRSPHLGTASASSLIVSGEAHYFSHLLIEIVSSDYTP